MKLGRPLGAALLAGWLTSCTMIVTQGVRELHFRADPAATAAEPARLLLDQRLPPWQLKSIPEALELAPPGSVLLVCWRSLQWSNFWGPCSHIGRKLSAAQLAESIGITEGGAGVYPISRLYNRYAVIVLDVGVRPEHLERMRAEVARLRGLPYDLSNQPGTYYCSTYQNELQRAMGLPDVVPYNAYWKMYVPAEVLQQPGVRLLWVGVNERSPGF